MKSLSQSEYGELRSLYESVYAPRFETILDEFTDEEVDELTEEIIEETVEEFFLECLEEGFDIDSVEETLCESLDTSITNLNETFLMEMNPYAPAGSKESKAYNKATTASKRSADRAAKRKEVIGKVKGAVKKAGSALKAGAGKVAGAARAGAGAAYKGASRAAGAAVGTVKKAGSVAKSEFKKGYDSASKSSSSDSGSSDSGSSSSSSSSGSSSSGSTRRAVGGAVRKVGSLLKKGLKKAVGGTARAVSKGADKVATRLGEEAVGEGIDFKGAAREQARRDAIQAEKDKKSPSSKQRRLALGKFRPGASAAERAEGGRDAMREKGTSPTKNGKKMFEELQATGLFTEKEIDAILEADVQELYKGKHGQTEKEYQDSRSDAGKMISGDSKRSGAAYSSRATKNTGPNPAGGSKRPQAQGRMGAKDREYLAYRKANMNKG